MHAPGLDFADSLTKQTFKTELAVLIADWRIRLAPTYTNLEELYASCNNLRNATMSGAYSCFGP